MFDNPTDNHTDIEVPLYDKLRFHEAKKEVEDSLILATISDDTWNLITTEHIIPNLPVVSLHKVMLSFDVLFMLA